MKGVVNKRWNSFKLPFLRYSTGESGMIVKLFSHRPFIKILFCRLTIWISRFPKILPEISYRFFRIFLKISRKIPTPPPITLTHTPHTTHPHPILPQTVNPLRTLNSLFSKTHFDCISTFISHTLHMSVPSDTECQRLRTCLGKFIKK